MRINERVLVTSSCRQASLFHVSPESDELLNTEDWIKVEAVDDTAKGVWLLIDENIECL